MLKTIFFSLGIWWMIMIRPMEVVCPIGHEIFYELIRHSLKGGCLMLGVITLVSANQTFVPQSDEYWNIHSLRVLGTHKLTIIYAFVEWQTLYFPNYFGYTKVIYCMKYMVICWERKLFTTHFCDYFATIYLVIIVICIRNDLSWT
jgi:hypothetical protein